MFCTYYITISFFVVDFLGSESFILFYFYYFLGKLVNFFFFCQFFILTKVICTKRQEIVDRYIVLLGIMGWVIYLFLFKFHLLVFYLIVWVRMGKKI